MPRTKPFFAQFTVWLILFQLLTPIAFAGFDITTICSSNGVKQIAMDAQGNPVELPSTQNHCELCILYSSNAPSILANATDYVGTSQRASHGILFQNTYHATANPLGFSSRAPPVFS